MSTARQLFEVILAGLIAGSSTELLALVIDADLAVSVAVILASMYYFSRYPWGSQRGEEYNELIDDLYDRYLPF